VQARRHAAFVSKNRVQLPETARAEAGALLPAWHYTRQQCLHSFITNWQPCAGHKAVSGSQPKEGFWHDVASLDFDAVAKSVHAMQPSCQPGNVAESDKAQADQEASDNVSPSAIGTGNPS